MFNSFIQGKTLLLRFLTQRSIKRRSWCVSFNRIYCHTYKVYSSMLNWLQSVVRRVDSCDNDKEKSKKRLKSLNVSHVYFDCWTKRMEKKSLRWILLKWKFPFYYFIKSIANTMKSHTVKFLLQHFFIHHCRDTSHSSFLWFER